MVAPGEVWRCLLLVGTKGFRDLRKRHLCQHGRPTTFMENDPEYGPTPLAGCGLLPTGEGERFRANTQLVMS